MYLIFHTAHTRIDILRKHIRRHIHYNVMLRLVVAKGWVGVEKTAARRAAAAKP